ncbi:MAG: polysaccharide deacetylase family protein [Gemmatimonadales bacterium]
MTFAAALLLAMLVTPAKPERLIAITFDDLPMVSATQVPVEVFEALTRQLVGSIVLHRVPAIGFVNEGKLYDTDGDADPRRVGLLEQWLGAGLSLGNHTWSHPDLHRMALVEFERDLLRGETVTRALLLAQGKPLRFFRHPFLHTGQPLAVRDSLLVFLDQHGYEVAPVTIDNSDYLFARAYDLARSRGDSILATRLATTYLDYMESVVVFYEGQADAIIGHAFPQVLLLHASALNAHTFDALATRLTTRGYHFVSLELALRDPAYQNQDRYAGNAGISWLQRWAITRGMLGSTFLGEPEVPDWVEAAAR